MFQPQAYLGGEVAKVALEGEVATIFRMTVQLAVALQGIATVAGQGVARVGTDARGVVVAG